MRVQDEVSANSLNASAHLILWVICVYPSSGDTCLYSSIHVRAPGAAYLALVEGRASVDPQKFETGLLQVLSRRGGKTEVTLKRQAHFYGYRGTDPDLLYLSPYEFERWWEVKQIARKHCAAPDKTPNASKTRSTSATTRGRIPWRRTGTWSDA